MARIRISGKELGALTLPDFCPRCFWIKMRCERKLPFQIFPGIFSTIDSYSKNITLKHYQHYGAVPSWFTSFGKLKEPVKVPHYSQFCVVDSETDILFTGVPDDIFLKNDGTYFIVDYKTAKYTAAQDRLLPMYDVQLNSYAYIAERRGLSPVTGLGLVYYEPVTKLSAGNIDPHLLDDGFSMPFSSHLLPIELKPEKIPPLLRRVREIYDGPEPPKGIEECKDCGLVDRLISVVRAGEGK